MKETRSCAPVPNSCRVLPPRFTLPFVPPCLRASVPSPRRFKTAARNPVELRFSSGGRNAFFFFNTVSLTENLRSIYYVIA